MKEDGQEERIVGHKKFMLELDIHTFSKAKSNVKNEKFEKGEYLKARRDTNSAG